MQVISHSISQTTVPNKYEVNFIVRNKTDSTLLPNRQYLEVDASAGTSHFLERKIKKANETFEIDYYEVSSIVMNDDFAVISCTSCNDNKGKIYVYTSSFKLQFKIDGGKDVISKHILL